jgi:tetratricopeptide (TPR) repeat protein
VGKSRLFWELTRSHRVQGWLTLETACASYGKTTGYLGVTDLLRTYFQIEAGDDPRRIREKVTGKVLTLDPALGSIIPVLLALLDVAIDEAAWRELDPTERRHRILDAVKRLLLRESRVQPLLLIVEDLHWVDAQSQAVLDILVDGLPASPALLLVNYRPEYEPQWGPKSYYTQVRLDSLPAEGAGALLDGVLGEDAGLGPLKRHLIEHTNGNPLFLEECVRALVEAGVLVGERGAYRAVGPAGDVRVPATVQTILAARIDRLPADEKTLLQVAAVIGERVEYPLLHAVAGLPEERLGAALAHLQSAELLYEASLFPDLEYTFKHALTHDVAYASLLQGRRRDLHGQILTALARLSADLAMEPVDQLAHHAYRGEMWDQAVGHLRRAGARATARSAHVEAVTCFERALEALSHLAASRDTTALAIDLRLDLRTALTPLGQYQRILDLLREAEAFARELHDDRRLGRVVADMSARLRNLGDHPGALEAGRRACEIAAGVRDRDLRVEATYRLAQAHFAVGDLVRAVELLRQTVDALGGQPPLEESRLPRYLAAWPRAWLALGLAGLGQFTEALAHGEEALRIAEAAEHPHSVVEAQAGLGRVHLERGDLVKAIALFQRGLAPDRARNMWDSTVLSGLGYAYALAGRVDEGLPLLRESVERGHAIDAMGIGHALRLSRLGEGYLLAGRLDEARERAHEALELSRAQEERGNEAQALRLLGVIASRTTPLDVEAAERYLREGLGLATALDLRPLAAHGHLALAQLYRRAREHERAREHRTTVTAMLRAMDMTPWLERLERELAVSEE